MKARIPYTFADGDTLSPSKLNTNIQRMMDDLHDAKKRRFRRTSFKLDFSGLSNTSGPSEFQYTIRLPAAYQIVGVELVVYEASGSTISLSNDVSGFLPISVATAGATSKASTVSNQTFAVASNTDVKWTLSNSNAGAYTIERCYAIIHIRTARNTTDTPSVVAPSIPSGAAVDPATLNTFFSGYETDVATETSENNGWRVQVYTRRQMAAAFPTSDRDFRIPSSQQVLHSYDVSHTGAAGDNLTVAILDEAAATVATVTVNGSGFPPNASQGNLISDTQTLDAPQTPGSDYKVRFSRVGAGIIPHAYAVLYFN